MARPPLAVGTFGKIGFTVDEGPPLRVRARTHFRDFDGVMRQVTKFGPSRAAAERALRLALRDRIAPNDSDLDGGTRVEALGRRWLEELPPDRSTTTRQTYTYVLENYVIPAIGALRVREVRTPTIDRMLAAITANAGPGAAKTARSVTSGMFKLAVRHGAVTVNPVREAASVAAVRRPRVRSLTVTETQELIALIRADKRAAELDLPDLVEFMLGTGVRIGEALAVRHGTNADGEPLLDLDHGTVEINATVVWVKGAGSRIQEWPKTNAGWRRLALPPYLVELLVARAARPRVHGALPVVFPSPLGRLRDASNTTGALRRTLDGIGCAVCEGRGVRIVDRRAGRCDAGPFAWVTSHTFRKTVATRLDEAGLSARQIADQLGHAHPSVTQDVYMGRKVVAADAAHVLGQPVSVGR